MERKKRDRRYPQGKRWGVGGVIEKAPAAVAGAVPGQTAVVHLLNTESAFIKKEIPSTRERRQIMQVMGK
jgi:hypothetical protein